MTGMNWMSKGKKKDLHRRPPTTRLKIIKVFQKSEAVTQSTAKSLKQLDLIDKKYESFIENLVSDGVLRQELTEGTTRYWLRVDKVIPKKRTGEGNPIITTIIIFLISFVIITAIFTVFFQT